MRARLPSDTQQRTAFLVKLFRHVTIYIIEDWPALPTLCMWIARQPLPDLPSSCSIRPNLPYSIE